MKKKTFKQELEQVKRERPLKKLRPDITLPDVFDMMWDAKTFGDLRNKLDDPTVLRMLAEHGYDVKGIMNENKQDT